MIRTKKYLIKAICFIALFCLLDRGLSTALMNRFERLRSAGPAGLPKRVILAKPNVIILGSSRAQHHFDPNIIAAATGLSTFNAGRDGLRLPFARAISEIVLDHYVPQILVLEIGPADLIEQVHLLHAKRIVNIAPYMHQYPVIKDMLVYSDSNYRLKFLARSYEFNSQLLYLAYDPFKTDLCPDSYVPLTGRLDPLDILRNDNPAPPLQISSEAIRLLQECIRLAKQKGTAVYVVTTPRWFPNHTYPDREARLVQLLRKITTEAGAVYLDVSQETYPIFRNPELFCDELHLNSTGATIMSEIFAQELLKNTPAPKPTAH
jgi:hypothetical protein